MPDPTTIGAYLGAARRRRRVSIQTAAEQTRIKADFLMRMESDEFDFLAPAYVRGFLSTYARFLRVDAGPLLEQFDRLYGTPPEAARLVAFDYRSKERMPRERRRGAGLLAAAAVALGAVAVLAVIGLLTGPEDDGDEPSRAAAATSSPSPTPEESPTPDESPTPEESPSPTPTEPPDLGEVLAVADAIELEVEVVRADCWFQIEADGTPVYTSPAAGLTVGDRAGPFTAEDEMVILLGNAYGVDLVINGTRVGPVGDRGEVLEISLPDDAGTLV